MNIGEKVTGKRTGAGWFYPTEPVLLIFDIYKINQEYKADDANTRADHVIALVLI